MRKKNCIQLTLNQFSTADPIYRDAAHVSGIDLIEPPVVWTWNYYHSSINTINLIISIIVALAQSENKQKNNKKFVNKNFKWIFFCIFNTSEMDFIDLDFIDLDFFFFNFLKYFINNTFVSSDLSALILKHVK